MEHNLNMNYLWRKTSYDKQSTRYPSQHIWEAQASCKSLCFWKEHLSWQQNTSQNTAVAVKQESSLFHREIPSGEMHFLVFSKSQWPPPNISFYFSKR